MLILSDTVLIFYNSIHLPDCKVKNTSDPEPIDVFPVFDPQSMKEEYIN